MIIIACIEDRYGMMFNHRRVSQDRALRERILERTKGAVLRMNAYSAKMFAETAEKQIYVSENFMEEAGPGEYCFLEDRSVLAYENKIERIVLFKWNRTYPSDLKFDIPLTEHGWRLTKTEDFPGFSHEKITEEIYEK